MRKPKDEYPAWNSWGVDPSQAMKQENQGFCGYCNIHTWGDGSRRKHTVGFSNDPKYQRKYQVGQSTIGKVGAEVYKCPGCGRLYWYHMHAGDQYFFDLDRDQGLIFINPEAEAAYQAMVVSRDKEDDKDG